MRLKSSRYVRKAQIDLTAWEESILKRPRLANALPESPSHSFLLYYLAKCRFSSIRVARLWRSDATTPSTPKVPLFRSCELVGPLLSLCLTPAAFSFPPFI